MNLDRVLKLAQAANLLNQWPSLKPIHDVAMKELAENAEAIKAGEIEAFDEGEAPEEEEVGRRV